MINVKMVPIIRIIFTTESPPTRRSASEELIGIGTVEIELNQMGDTALALTWACLRLADFV